MIDNGSTLTVADDLAQLPREQVDTAAVATFARRRPTLPELRAVHQLIHGKVIRREDLDTTTGRTLARLRSIGIIANADRPRGVRADPPQLADDIRCSLLLDDEETTDVGAAHAYRRNAMLKSMSSSWRWRSCVALLL